MSFLPIAAVALSAAAPIAGGIMESKGLRREADALDESGRRDESQGAADAVDALRASRMQLGEDMASLAGSGFAIGSGSADDLLSAALIEREFEAMNIRETARLQAEEKRAAAQDRRKSARQAIFMGILNGATAAVAGASQMRSDARASNRNASARAVQTSGYGVGPSSAIRRGASAMSGRLGA